jgi:MFS family permease
MNGKEKPSRNTVKSILIRDYVFNFLAFFGFLGAYFALVPTLPIYLARLGSDEREIGVLVGTIGITSLVARFLAGSILRKYPERSIMMGGVMLFALSFLALIVFRPFWPFFAVRLLQGIAFASLDTAAIAYAIRIVPENHRARAISYFLLAPSLAAAIASSLAVFVVNEYGFTLLLLVCTGLCLYAFLLFWRLKGRETREFEPASPSRANLFFEPRILAPAVVSFMVFFSWGGVVAFFPLYSLQCGVTNPGYFFSANAAMLVAVRIFGGKVLDIYSKERMIPILLAISIVGLVSLSFSSTLPMFILIGALWGVGGGFLAPVAMAYALEYAGSSDGTAVGTYQAFRDLGLALGPVATGIIVPLTGYRLAFLCLAFTCIVNLCYFQFYLKERGRHAHTT